MSKKNSKIYAVRKGRTTGILMSWADCLKSVDKFPDAQYKSFPRGDISAANDYLNQRKWEHAPNLLSNPVAGGFGAASVEIASLAVAASKFGANLAKQWQSIEVCPPAPYKPVNVAYVDDYGDMRMHTYTLCRLPDMTWVCYPGIGGNFHLRMSEHDVARFRYYLEIPEWPVK